MPVITKERCDLQGRPAEVLRRLDELIAQDSLARSRTNNALVGGCGLFLLGFVGLFVHGALKWPGTVMMALGLLGTVVSINLYRRYNPLQLEPTKLATARRLLEVLARDLRPNKRVKLRLDFREPHEGVFVARREGDKSHFSQPWLDLDAVVADGTSLSLEVVRRGRRRVRKKRRGESVKGRLVDLIKVTLKVNPARYPDLTEVPELLRDPPPGLTRKSFQAGTDWVRLVATTTPAQYGGSMDALANGARLLGSLAWAFHAVKSVKALHMP